MADQPSCGEALVALLESYGVDTVFGIPGDHNLELYRGLENSGIRTVLTRHEQGAGFMADGYARASGRPGVCFVITGPGVTNILTAMGEAYSDSVPMLVISSVNETEHLGKGRGRLHEIPDQRAVTAQLTAFSATALLPGDIPELVQRAYASFESERPRPVHIEVPLDVLAAPATFGPRNRPAISRPVPAADAVAEAADLLGAAKRPVVIVGGGARDHGALLIELAELAGAAVTLTTAAKGAVPDDHPLCVGATLVREETHALLAAADVVVAVGTEFAQPDSWVDHFEFGGPLVRIDIDPRMLYGDYEAQVALHGDSGATLELLLAAVRSRSPEPAKIAEDAVFRTARNASRLPQQNPAEKERMHAALLDVLRAVLPEDGFVVCDPTQVTLTGTTYFPCSLPRTWLHPVGYCALGYGLPAAIGAKLAAPSRATVALVGDYGLMFTVQELATAVELGLPIPIVVWNNEGLGQIRDGMDLRGVGHISVNPLNPDFLALARSFGCEAVRPDSLEAFGQALGGALKADRPTLIEVREDAPFLA